MGADDLAHIILLWFFQLEAFKFCYVKDTRQTLQMAWNGGRRGTSCIFSKCQKKDMKTKILQTVMNFLAVFQFEMHQQFYSIFSEGFEHIQEVVLARI